MGEMARYVTRMPGKKIRPLLALLGAGLIRPRALNEGDASPSRAVRLAAAVEMIHTATLLHDDVIDGAALRRGFLTVHGKWGDTLSVLSGDYLYSKAFCLLSALDHPEVLQLMSETARTVCEGEVAQIHHRFDLSLSRRRYLKIIEHKTASLMAASARAGALLAGAPGSQALCLGEFGLHFGIAFQILDDTRDLVGEEDDEKKSLGTDLSQGHLTLPLIYLKERADARTRRVLAHCFNGSSAGRQGNGAGCPPLSARECLALIKDQALRCGVPADCRKAARAHLAKAETALEPFGACPHKTALLALVEYLRGR